MNMPPKRSLTIEAIVGPNHALLGDITAALRVLPLPPESFMWSVLANSREARVWLTLSDHDDNLRDLVARLQDIPGIQRILVHGATGATLPVPIASHLPPPSPTADPASDDVAPQPLFTD